jgi:hypothetical protein
MEVFISHDGHTLFVLEEWASSDDLHMQVPVGNLALIGLDLPLTALIGVAERRRKILTYTQINKK